MIIALLHTTTSQTTSDDKISMPANVSSSGTAHASDSHTRDVADNEKGYCSSCHSPNSFAISDLDSAGKTIPQAGITDKGGLTCASCHLTPEGNVRSVVHSKNNAPHKTVEEPALQTSAICGHCHSGIYTDKRVIGKQFQTFREWQEDYFKPGLGKQQCQDCHMPRTLRKIAEEFDGTPRAVARHLWSGANSRQRHLNSLSLTIIQPEAGKQRLSFSVNNIGAGHSVPTGSGARAVFLVVDILDKKGISRDRKEWMFAPSYGDRPDDKSFLEEDKKLSGGKAAAQAQADAQGPHESSIRAGEDRILSWEPSLNPGEYIVNARLSYTINRFDNKLINDNRSELGSATLIISTK